MIDETIDWLAQFKTYVIEAMKTHKWTELVNSLVQMGISDPKNPEEDYFDDEDEARFYNKSIYKMLEYTDAIKPCRKVLLKDMKAPSPISTVDGKPMTEFGPIVLRSYAQELLDHFLTPKPDWC